jgi:Flp pilus assembly CpaE family ATPase
LATGVGQDRLKLILNRVPKSPELTVGELEKMLGLPVYRSIPNDYPTLYEAYSSGALAPANSKLGRNFSDLARSVAGIEAQETKSRFKLFG